METYLLTQNIVENMETATNRELRGYLRQMLSSFQTYHDNSEFEIKELKEELLKTHAKTISKKV